MPPSAPPTPLPYGVLAFASQWPKAIDLTGLSSRGKSRLANYLSAAAP